MARTMICMGLLEKTDHYAIYVYGGSPDHLDGKLKISIDNPRSDYSILIESAVGHVNTMLAYSKLARLIEQGEFPEKVNRVS